ncbi:MAG: type III-B CRISPR-associated protein Cas10/Cmr2 [Thermoplasmataceae archaeon]
MTNLYFTIGPVQNFIAQSRRTRDLWSGSFLLSYLSGCAMRGAGENEIGEPYLNDNPMWMSIMGKGSNLSQNSYGGLPNVFTIETKEDDPNVVAQKCIQEFMNSWKKIADLVYDSYVREFEGNGNRTREIWNRQVNNFWEISFAAGNEHSIIEARKSWRWRNIPPEGGDHCTMMGDFQELSGYTRSNNKNFQAIFWTNIRKGNKVGKLDLDDDERLCAIAFIKRFFPSIAPQIIPLNDNNITNWPSTVYMSAVPWLKNLQTGFGDDYYNSLKLLCENNILRAGIPAKIGLNTELKIATLDGNFLFKETLSNEKLINCNKLDKDKRKELVSHLKDLQKTSEPSPYFALLLMDGDNMGKIKGSNENLKSISKSLSSFSNQVNQVVKNHNGITIYTGGDDVLAMLPSVEAIACAYELSEKFRMCFNGVCDATISAGVALAHYHVPLLSVYEEAKKLLDEIAKESNGRNSLAVGVINNSGKSLQWVTSIAFP